MFIDRSKPHSIQKHVSMNKMWYEARITRSASVCFGFGFVPVSASRPVICLLPKCAHLFCVTP